MGTEADLTEAPPQPASTPVLIADASSRESCRRRLFLRTKIQSAPASVTGGGHGPGFERSLTDVDVAFGPCTVSENVVLCCSELDVAVTVTVDLEDGLDAGCVQPVSTAIPNAQTTKRRVAILRHFFLLNRHSPAANTDPGNQKPSPL